jgi:hypothetical protein
MIIPSKMTVNAAQSSSVIILPVGNLQ